MLKLMLFTRARLMGVTLCVACAVLSADWFVLFMTRWIDGSIDDSVAVQYWCDDGIKVDRTATMVTVSWHFVESIRQKKWGHWTQFSTRRHVCTSPHIHSSRFFSTYCTDYPQTRDIQLETVLKSHCQYNTTLFCTVLYSVVCTSSTVLCQAVASNLLATTSGQFPRNHFFHDLPSAIFSRNTQPIITETATLQQLPLY
jgi:hypothetical protein